MCAKALVWIGLDFLVISVFCVVYRAVKVCTVQLSDVDWIENWIGLACIDL